MKLKKISSFFRDFRLSLKMKLILSLSSIAIILLISSIISIMEYSRMSNYVTELIAENIGSINASQRLANAANAYNLGILAVIGENTPDHVSKLHQVEFLAHCDSLKASLTSEKMLPLADSVLYSYSAYMLTSMELPQVIISDFVDTREWYFNRLQPVYGRLRSDIQVLNDAIYAELQHNSATFERGFYRSIIPGAVAVAVGLLMVLMLMFFLMIYYVKPINSILSGVKKYKTQGAKYTYKPETDDEIGELSDCFRIIIAENRNMENQCNRLKQQIDDMRQNRGGAE